MKAIVLVPGTTDVRLVEWQERVIQAADEVKIRIWEVGICGTDRDEAGGGHAVAPPEASELVMGHESFGEVTETGEGVKEIEPGDKVVLTMRRGCGNCDPCRMSRSDMCTTGEYTERGIKGRDGYQAEYVVDVAIHQDPTGPAGVNHE